MLCLQRPTPRHGKHGLEPIILLSTLVFLALVFVRVFFHDSRPLGQQLFSAFLGALQCFGVFLGLVVLLASAEMLKHTAARARARRLSHLLGWLAPWRADRRLPASPDDVNNMRALLHDPDDALRQFAFDTLFTVLRASPALATEPRLRPSLLQALACAPGLAQALAVRTGEPLLPCITLGAKLGAGTADKRLAPPTEDAAELARWALANRDPDAVEEVQVSVGFDTGTLPGLDDRARFIGLWLFLAGTELSRFQALDRRPRRDPNAAFGLIIRGDIVDVRCPGQARGHRLDYVFPLPERDEAGLADLFGQLQALNLGLLAACTEDACRVFFPDQLPPWLDERCRAAASAYRRFERDLVSLLRRFDRFRDPEAIHRTFVSDDDEERRQATVVFRLEECLYPQYRWVVPLYELDTSWERLLLPLRAVEGMLLHQGEAEAGRTRGAEFVYQARLLGESAARQILQAAEAGKPCADVPLDPFLDLAEEEASRNYLARVRRALGRKEMTPEQLPGPCVFLRAEAYYFNGPPVESQT